MKDRSKSYEKKQKKKKSHKSDKKSRHKSERKAKKDKNEKKREKELKKRLKEEKRLAQLQKLLSKKSEAEVPAIEKAKHEDDYCGPSIDLMNRAKCPETKEQWEHRQSQIKRVVDPETGRIRLIKGDGEILEEIVPRERHKQINQEATKNDGKTFQKNTVGAVASRFK